LFVARDIDGLEEWYIDNAGRQSTAPLIVLANHLDISLAFLTANNGNGHVSQETGTGRWIVEDYQALDCRIGVNNVTVRNCYFYKPTGGGLYGIQALTAQNPNPTGIIIEYCEIDGGTGVPARGVYFANSTEPGQITVRYCNIHNYQLGIGSNGGITAEYCYVHDLYYFEGGHFTSMSNRGRNCTFRRNLCMNNTSSMNMYAETTPYTGVLVEENIIRADNALNDISFPDDKPYHTPQPGETRRAINNLLWRLTGMNNFANWTEMSGNIDFAGNPVIEG